MMERVEVIENASSLNLNLGGDRLVFRNNQLIDGVTFNNNSSKNYSNEQGTQATWDGKAVYTTDYLRSNHQ